MKRSLFLLAIVVATLSLQGAVSDFQTLLDAQRVGDVLRFSINGSTVMYRIDNSRSGILHEQGDTFVAPGAVDLTYHQFNPFKVIVTSSEVAAPDPVQKAISDFATAVAGVAKVILPSTDETTTSAQNFMLRLNLTDQDPCAKVRLAIADLNRKLSNLDTNNPSSDDLQAWIAQATGLAGIQAVEIAITAKKTALNAAIKDAETAKKTEEDAATAAAGAQCPALTPDQFNVLTNYGPKVTQAKQVVQSLDGLFTALDSFAKRVWRTSETPSDDLVIRTTESDPAQMKTVTLTFQTVKYTMDATTHVVSSTNDAPFSRTFIIRRARNVVPMLGAEAIWNSLRYPTYTAKDGKVVRGYDKSNVNAAVTLNLLCNCWGGSGLYPGLQFGASKAKDYPGFMIGGVLVFGNDSHLAVSMGGLITWYKDLSSLTVDGTVDSQDTLNKDLKLRLSKPAFYFGAQYTFQ